LSREEIFPIVEAASQTVALWNSRSRRQHMKPCLNSKIFPYEAILTPPAVVLVVAHRLATVQNADVIFVIGEGKVLEKGDHNTLLRKRGVYYSMVSTPIFLAFWLSSMSHAA